MLCKILEIKFLILLNFVVTVFWFTNCERESVSPAEPVLHKYRFQEYAREFNDNDIEDVVNWISNANCWQWMTENIPFFECPDKEFEKIYYFRWWTYRKHIKKTPAGFVLSEFIIPVKHAGIYNTISCAAGHHLMEGRWLKQQDFLDQYVNFWLHGNSGKPQTHLHNYSNWLPYALYQRYLVNGDSLFLEKLLPELKADYEQWEQERMLPNGMFW
jgi:hypothetical protein